MPNTSVNLDLRAVLAIAALGIVVLAIIFVELCGREDVEDLFVQSTPVPRETATMGPTITPGPSPTTAPAEATAAREITTGAETRDTTRATDLVALQDALALYREENGTYPDTAGNIQTLCAFTEADIGCALREVLDPLPEDPLGDSVSNGYFYAANNTSFTLYALRESDLFPECAQHPDHLQNLDSLICVEGP